METNITLEEEIAKIIKTKVDKRYKHYIILGIPLNLDLGKLNEKRWKEREIKRILENIKWNLYNY